MGRRAYCPWCMGELEDWGSPCPSCGRDPGACVSMEHQLPPGTVLAGRYLLGRVLGQGGFGITYIGIDLTLELRVAVKEYFPPQAGRSSDGTVYSFAGDGSLARGRDAFLAEARAMSRASALAEAVAGARDVLAERGTAYLVMDYVEGETLGAWAAARPGGRAPSAELLPLLRPVAEALRTLHGAGVVHRDISPANVMVDAGGRAFLIDFGLARDFEATALTTAMNTSFAPVEQWTRGGQGPWTDVYALCATIYACLTGAVPPSSVERLANDPLVPPREAGADLTERQEKALLRGLAVQPADRTQSMGELVEGLFGGGLDEEDRPERERREAEEREQERREAEERERLERERQEAEERERLEREQRAAERRERERCEAQERERLERERREAKERAHRLERERSEGADRGRPISRRALLGWAAVLAGAGAIGYLWLDGGLASHDMTGNWSDVVAIACGRDHTVAVMRDGTCAACGDNEYGQCDVGGWTDVVAVACGNKHTVALRGDGTCAACGDNEYGQCDVGGWTDVVAVACGYSHTVALRGDGTCAACGHNYYGWHDVEGWTDVVTVVCGEFHTVAIREDGTCAACGDNYDGRCDVGEWSDVVAVACGYFHTVALRGDGTCVASGDNDDGQCDVGEWTDIVAVACGYQHTVGIRRDGTCVASGGNSFGQCDVGEWTDVVAVVCRDFQTFALRGDGTCVARGSHKYGETNVRWWTDVVAVACGGDHVVALRGDGTCVARGKNDHGQCGV